MRRSIVTLLVLGACSAPQAAAPPEPRASAARVEPRASAPAAAAHELALFRRFPRLAERLPWVKLADLPTPIESYPELAARIGVGQLWVKRDDLSAAPYGGNKVRKLEFFLGEALAKGNRSVLTFGGVGSNHALATAVHARRLGLSAILLLLPQQNSEHVRHNLLALAAQGAELHLTRALDERSAARPYLHGRGSGEQPYVIPTGGTSPLGDIGLVNAGFELAEQVAAGALPTPDEVWVAFGTGGTAAGIALGIAAAGLSTRVVCVRVSSPRYGTWRHLREAFDRTRDHLRAVDPSFPSVELSAERATLLHDFAGRGYGIPSHAGGRARLLARQAGLELDDTYTAKTLAALAALAAERKDRVIVFWNTYDARALAPAATDGAALPAELRGYLR